MAVNGGRRVINGSSSGGGAVMPQNQVIPCSNSLSLDGFFITGSSSSFKGSSSMVSFDDLYGGKRSERPFFCTYDQEENGDEEFEDYFHQPEKKRRLTVEQVQFLEKSFEIENKLEPERKTQLAKDLSLQPRQIAIWFQNRRARWKTKQLGKDFDALQATFDNLKDDYDNLLKEKEKLQAEVDRLTDKLSLKKEFGDDFEPPILCENQPKNHESEPIFDSSWGSDHDQYHIANLGLKHEDLCSTKSDLVDSESIHNVVDGIPSSSFAELIDTSYAAEVDHSDISQDDEDYLYKTLLPTTSHLFFPNMEDIHPDPLADSSNFGLTHQDHASLF